MISVIGLDLSLNSSGYSYRDPEPVPGQADVRTGRIKPGKRRGVERLFYNRNVLDEIITRADQPAGRLTLAVIEGYAMGYGGKKGATPGRVFNIGEWGGIARLALWDRGIPMLIVSPGTLKVFATTNGNAEKPEVIQAIAEIWEYDIPQDDEADAFALMMLGEAYLSKRKRRRYGPNRLRALDAVEYVDVPDPFGEV